jgi:hypothetical protein
MANFKSSALLALSVLVSHAGAQQQTQGFAVERLYPSAPGGGWFVMDDLNISGGLGGVISLTSSYARNPFEVANPDGAPRLPLVLNEAFVDLGVAITYDRYRVYVDIPMPIVINGNSGIVGPYQLTAPALNLAQDPDAVSDPRLGFDVRLLGKPGDLLRLGAGAQLLFPSGDRFNYETDGRYRGMLRFLAAGDSGPFSYAGQLGVHLRPMEGLLAPGGPDGNEFLFGVSGGRKFSIGGRWTVIAGPEFFGETAFHSFFSGLTGMEGLMTGRLERTGDRPHLRFKMGVGHALIQHFGAPEWRILAGVELIGQR